jgi:hypothetical protein
MLTKKLFTGIVLILSACILQAQINFTATYDFSGDGNNVVNFEYNGDAYDGINCGDLIKVGITSSSSTGNFRGNDWPIGATDGSDVFTGDLDPDKYISFSIAAVSGYNFNISSIEFGVGRSAAGPRQFLWKGSEDGFTGIFENYSETNAALTNENGIITAPDANSNWFGNTFEPGLQYQELEGTVEFRLFGYNAEASGGTGGAHSSITINGTFESLSEQVIAVSPVELQTFSYIEGQGPSDLQTVSISGSNLLDNINLEIPVDFEFSLTEDPFNAEIGGITIEHVGGSVSAVDIFIRLKEGLTEGLFNEIITVSSTGAVDKTIELNGEVLSNNPELSIISPENAATFYNNEIEIEFELVNFIPGTDGKIKYIVNEEASMYHESTDPIILSDLITGEYTVTLELVDTEENSLDPVVTDMVTFNISLITSGGMETFDNSNASGSYGDGSFVGNSNITWNYFHSRDEEEFPINGKGLMLRRAEDSKLESGLISGGIGDFSMKMRKAFTGTAERQLELYINGDLKGTSEPFGTEAGEDETIYMFNIENINVADDFTMMIKNVGETATNRQTVIDDISWTAFDSDQASLTINSPTNGQIIEEDNTEIQFSVSNFVLGTDGKIAYTINGGPVNYHETEDPIQLTDLSNGEYTVVLELVDIAEQSLDPAVVRQVEFEIVLPVTEPNISIISPANGAYIYETNVDIEFEILNFDINTEGKIAYSVNAGTVMYHQTTDPISFTDLAIGQYTIEVELVDNDEFSLDPAVTDQITINIAEQLPGGMETFENSNATASYTNGSFVGNNDIVWNYYHSRDEGDFPINVEGMMLRRASDSKLESNPISGGISNFSMKMRKAFTGTSERQLELYINGDLKGTSEIFGTADGEDATVHIFEVNNINVMGDFVMMIKNVGDNEINRQTVIDDISWTGFMSSDPYISITSPANGENFLDNNVDITYNVYNFTPGVDGYIAYTINSEPTEYQATADAIQLTDLELGDYTVVIELVDNEYNSLDPVASASVNFSVIELEFTSIYEIQFTEDPSGDSPLAGETVTTAGIVTGVFANNFWIQDGSGAWNGLFVYNTSYSPPEIGDSIIIEGKVKEQFGLTELEFISYLEIVSTGNELPAASIVQTGEASQEKWESVLIQVNGLCTDDDAGYGMWKVNDGSGEVLIDDDLYDYTPNLNHSYSVTGPMYYSYSEFKILPRFEADIIDNGLSSDPFLSITSPQSGETIFQNSVNVSFTVTNFTINTDGKVAWKLNDGEYAYVTTSPIIINNLDEGNYTITLQLVDMDENPIDPAVITSVTFSVNLSGPEFTDIYDIQYTELADGDSPLANQTLWVKGVVSANFNTSVHGEGYYLQQGGGEWRGIYVEDFVNSPEIGDSVILRGTVKENFDMTLLENISNYSVFAIGGVVAEPTVITTLQASSEEAYESVLVKVTNAECVSIGSYGEWNVDDGSGEAICKDNGAFAFTPVVGVTYDVTGVIFYGYENYSIHFRIPSDIVSDMSIEDNLGSNYNVYPNPASDFINIETEIIPEKISVLDLTGRVLLETKPDNNITQISISNLPGGIYFIEISDNQNITRTKITVE